MTGPDGYFDERVAATYDEDAADMFEAATLDPAVDFLAGIARGGPALELGIGTGRIALPLAERGVPVHGLELSRAMAARLRNKPGGDAIDVTIGDFATTTVDATFSVAYLVFNTIMNLTTQEAQVMCFRNVAAHLQPGGCFVVEVMVPELRRLPPGETFRVSHAERRLLEHRRVRRRDAGPRLPSPRGRRRRSRAHVDAVPVRVARGARPDGGARGPAAAGTVGRLDARALHEREPRTRLGLGEALSR